MQSTSVWFNKTLSNGLPVIGSRPLRLALFLVSSSSTNQIILAGISCYRFNSIQLLQSSDRDCVSSSLPIKQPKCHTLIWNSLYFCGVFSTLKSLWWYTSCRIWISKLNNQINGTKMYQYMRILLSKVCLATRVNYPVNIFIHYLLSNHVPQMLNSLVLWLERLPWNSLKGKSSLTQLLSEGGGS